MTVMWFGLALIALLGAAVLLYVDRNRRRRFGKVRQVWAKARGYRFTPADAELPARWSRSVLANQEFLSAVDIVEGVRRGEEFVLFDLEESHTVVAVRRDVGSDVDIDLRLRSAAAPKDSDMELLGSLGPRIIFSTDLDVARRVCDQRMVAFTHSVPGPVLMLWSENDWTLGTLAVGSTARDWDDAIDAVTRLSGLLHVLPPAASAAGAGARSRGDEQSRVERPVPRNAAGRPEAGRERAGRPEAGRQGPARPEAGRERPARPEAGRERPARPEAGRERPARPEVGRERPAKPEAGREGPERPQPIRQNPLREARQDPGRDNPLRPPRVEPARRRARPEERLIPLDDTDDHRN